MSDTMMGTAISKRIEQVLQDADNGLLKIVQLDHSWKEVYAGNVIFKIEGGWLIEVFNDCDSWDYMDKITTPEGDVYSFNQIAEGLNEWGPESDRWEQAPVVSSGGD